MEEIYIGNKNGRIPYIEGLRGLLAILVVINHVVCCFYPWMFYNEKTVTTFDRIWVNSPLNAISNGNFAVQIFYVVSGYLITKKFMNDKGTTYKLIRQYLKVLKITVPSILICCAVMKLGLTLNVQTANLNSDFNILYNLNNFEPTWGGCSV